MDSRATILLFHTSNHAIRAERLLKRAGLKCRLKPVPRHLSSDCGVSLEIEWDTSRRSQALLAAAGVTVAGVHDA